MEVLTSKQLAEWESFDQLEPTGEWRDDLRMASICSIITNLATAIHGKKGSEKTSPEDFMFDWDGLLEEGKQKQSAEEMKQQLFNIFKKTK